MMLDVEIDLETSYEFIKEIFNNITPEQFQQVIKDLEKKEVLFQSLLTKEKLSALSKTELTLLTSRMFSTRRISKRWTDDHYDKFKTYTLELLYGPEDFSDRFEKFCSYSKKNLKMKKAYEVASEMLSFSDPDKYWLWSSFMWNPETDTGSLSLVFNDKKFLQNAPSFAELYTIVGQSLEKIKESSAELGIEVTGTANKYDVPMFLGSVYTIYLFTVTRVQMTNEFTTILPTRLEILKRLFGIYNIEINKDKSE